MFQIFTDAAAMAAVAGCVLAVSRAGTLRAAGNALTENGAHRADAPAVRGAGDCVRSDPAPGGGLQDTGGAAEEKARGRAGRGGPGGSAETLSRLADGQGRAPGEDCPETLAAVHRLGSALSEAGRHAEARVAFGKAVKGRRRVLGPANPLTIESETALVGTLEELDGLGALLEKREVLEWLSDSLLKAGGESDPAALLTLAALGFVTLGTGDCEAARDAFSRAAVLTRAAFGPASPEALRADENLALALYRTGDAEGCVALLGKVSAAWAASPQADAEEVLRTGGLLSSILSLLGRTEEAEAAMERAELAVSAGPEDVAGRA
ncbi:MAG: tetratricopeptide repeat protein [Deltaproteobacteria bacterium]|jgi:hypothetical protein|nr:tetratricopeptide repeat protein [Deltaproteobacteria bacterium]